jgi:hypothetical protein
MRGWPSIFEPDVCRWIAPNKTFTPIRATSSSRLVSDWNFG